MAKGPSHVEPVAPRVADHDRASGPGDLYHEQWHKDLLRTLVVRLVADAPDLSPGAHHRCRFGQWYNSEASGFLREYPAFIALDRAHEQMHGSATKLLQRVADELPVAAGDVDQFNNLLDHLRLELHSLRREFVEMTENRDPLTGARNRVGLLSDLREQQALVRRSVQECALVLIDLDHFKDINDRHGHGAGDVVLSSTSECLLSNARPYDRVHRYGGEEFLLCMPGTTVVQAVGTAERLRALVESQQVRNVGDAALLVTASLGVAGLDATLAVEESIDRADRAMYQAKTG